MLRTSALTLAREQLPAVVARLRRGESVDVAAEAPPVHEGNDEIGQVGQAIDAVRQTAIRSAIDEARVRQGVNDMFRNLARRNQSLLQRQLSVLDDMERRATDPDVLEDLFKMDHLTTRMRRHAEGLIILSGAPPGRSWSAPVKLIDVMRGAVAEVEDYARVTASTQSKAALSGSAVTDVIHLLAELIENATTLSPPFTQVRVGGESVANGFAIEIEDRGLGLSPQRLAELNDRLANPPDINPANTEQLGLFVVGQLARRHGINVTLRPSPYGGTTAVALIPRVLVVDEGPAALSAGGAGAPGIGAARNGAARNGAAGIEAPGPAGPYVEPAGIGAGGAWAGTGSRAGAFAAGSAAPSAQNATGAVSLPATPAAGNDWRGRTAGPPRRRNRTPCPCGERRTARSARRPTRLTRRPRGSASPGSCGRREGPLRAAPLRARFAPGSSPAPFAPGNGAEAGGRRGRHGTDDVPVVTGVPVGRPTPSPAAPFDVFTPMHRPEQDAPAPAEAGYRQAYPDFGGAAPEPAPESAYGGGSNGGGDFFDDSYQGDGLGASVGNNGAGRRPLSRRGRRRGQRPRPACLAASARPASPRSFARPAGRRPAARPASPRPAPRPCRTCGTPCRPCSAAGSRAGRRRNRRRRTAAPMESSQRYPASQLDWVLDDLVRRVPHITRAVFLSQDGLALGASQGLEQADTEHLAALAAGFNSLARGASRHFGGDARQSIIEMTSGFFIVSAAGQGTCLAVLTTVEADIGQVAYEMAILVQRTGDHLQVNMRTRSALSDNARNRRPCRRTTNDGSMPRLAPWSGRMP